eukprot:CAMPEP_0182473672 /NCGR_PEP_ID=MMETSP1319-20130603/24367_1 /TAXON_ID=172717 /ORGANISM="Bolidomonas pacifica, Strain RCC208" /LENGTH=78 /DNA_ID=CAMNT_0024674497 /DNA_START=156 /DNA_END=389 /DNA_ORIENTATION=-
MPLPLGPGSALASRLKATLSNEDVSGGKEEVVAELFRDSRCEAALAADADLASLICSNIEPSQKIMTTLAIALNNATP